MNWIVERMKEPSTWRGIIMIAGATGLITADQADALGDAVLPLVAAMFGSGMVGVVGKG